jgi:Domain of unknown function (DUF4349)
VSIPGRISPVNRGCEPSHRDDRSRPHDHLPPIWQPRRPPTSEHSCPSSSRRKTRPRRWPDVSSRVTSDEATIAQLQDLLRRAGLVPDLLTVQEPINSEESDLESLQAEQSALDHETSYATVSVTILGPKTAAKRATHKKPAPAPGLTSGLSAGWHAFCTALSWFLAIVGAVAPFAAVLGWLAYWLRWRLAQLIRGRRPVR